MSTKFGIIFSAAAMESGLIALRQCGSWAPDGFLSMVIAYGAFVVLFMFFLGFRVWRLECRFEQIAGILGQFKNLQDDSRNGQCSERGVRACCVPSWRSFECRNCVRSKEPVAERACSCQWRCRNSVCRNAAKVWPSKEFKDDQGEDEGEIEIEEEGIDGYVVEDVLKLRKEVLKERQLRAAAMIDLEKERMAAISATQEAMAKILRLENQKGLIEREACDYRAIAELKRLYDKEVIEDLRWIISRFKEERQEK